VFFKHARLPRFDSREALADLWPEKALRSLAAQVILSVGASAATRLPLFARLFIANCRHMRKNAPFMDTYRTKCSVLGTMRALVSTVFATPVAMLIIAFGLSGNAGSVLAPKLAQNGSIAVNTEVVLAVDVSASMTPDEQALQREGYVQALSSREFIQALKASGNGRISITYFEWANVSDQKIILPWRLIDGPEAAGAVAAELARAPYRHSSRTSISGGLIFAQSLFESARIGGCAASLTCLAMAPTMTVRS
jgi:hypothetical protein